jgi:hypothetical protein
VPREVVAVGKEPLKPVHAHYAQVVESQVTSKHNAGILTRSSSSKAEEVTGRASQWWTIVIHCRVCSKTIISSRDRTIMFHRRLHWTLGVGVGVGAEVGEEVVDVVVVIEVVGLRLLQLNHSDDCMKINGMIYSDPRKLPRTMALGTVSS